MKKEKEEEILLGQNKAIKSQFTMGWEFGIV